MLAAIEAKKDEDVDGALRKSSGGRGNRKPASGGKPSSSSRSRNPLAETNDTNYIFLSFVTRYLPAGLVGLILAAILSASMSASRRGAQRPGLGHGDRYLQAAGPAGCLGAALSPRFESWPRSFWGLYAIAFAQFANHLGSLIEAVNIMGSLFYGTILGIFLIAFYFKRIGGQRHVHRGDHRRD